MNSRIDLLSEVIELMSQYKKFKMLQENIKFLQMELKMKNVIINNQLDTPSAILESLTSQQLVQNSKKLYVGNLNTNVTEDMSCLDSNLQHICVKIAVSKCQSIQILENQWDLHF